MKFSIQVTNYGINQLLQLTKPHQRGYQLLVSSFKICFQNYGQLKRTFLRPKNTSSTFQKFELSRLCGPMVTNYGINQLLQLTKPHQRGYQLLVSSFKICFQNYGQLKRTFLRPKNTSSTFQKFELSRLCGPMLKTRKNTIRNQFEQQWFHVISFQKPRRAYTAI